MPYVSDEVRAAKIASTATLLIALDPPWTARSVTGLNSDREPSLIIVGQMLEGLAVLRSEQDFLTSIEEVLDQETIKKTLGKSALSTPALNALMPLLTPEQIRKRAATLPKTLTDEMRQLSAQAAVLRSGRAPSGDMSRAGKCAIGWIMLAAGAIPGAGPLATVGGQLISENCSLVV